MHVKKMLHILVCLFLGLALGADFNSYRSSNTHMATTTLSPLPMDYNDDMYNRNFQTKLNSNLIFNFEQLRRDQPPQIEYRNENLGLYMRRRPTTTTTPEPTTKKVSEHPAHEATNAILPPNRFAIHSPEHSYPEQMQSNPTIPTLSTPSWPKFGRLNSQSFPQFPSRSTKYKQNHPVHTYPSSHQSIISIPQPAPQSSQHMTSDFKKVQPPQAHHFMSHIPNESQKTQLPPIRGNHKFDWNDATTMNPVEIVLSSTPHSPPHQNRDHPPPIPTLSPWYGDNFGK